LLIVLTGFDDLKTALRDIDFVDFWRVTFDLNRVVLDLGGFRTLTTKKN
jgi:hypothetical protein